MIRVVFKSLAAAAVGAAMLAAAPASAAYVWIYYGASGEVIGYKVANNDGTLCTEWGMESSSWSFSQGPGDAC